MALEPELIKAANLFKRVLFYVSVSLHGILKCCVIQMGNCQQTSVPRVSVMRWELISKGKWIQTDV